MYGEAVGDSVAGCPTPADVRGLPIPIVMPMDEDASVPVNRIGVATGLLSAACTAAGEAPCVEGRGSGLLGVLCSLSTCL